MVATVANRISGLNNGFFTIFAPLPNADVLKLVDKPDLGSGAARRVGSSPPVRTKRPTEKVGLFYFMERTRLASRCKIIGQKSTGLFQIR